MLLASRSIIRHSCPTIQKHSRSVAAHAASVSVSAPASGAMQHQQRRAESPWVCPACSNPSSTPDKILQHMSKCCGDLLQHMSMCRSHHNHQLEGRDLQLLQQLAAGKNSSLAAACNSSDDDALLQQLLASAAEREQVLRRQVLRLQFVADDAVAAAVAAETAEAATDTDTDTDDDAAGGDQPCNSNPAAEAVAAASSGIGLASQAQAPSRRRRRNKLAVLKTPEQIGRLLDLPHKRVMRLIERAPRSIQLVADSEALVVVYEDDYFLAVCKPPGLRSAPVHRFMGGSAFNQMIGYLGYEPHLLHRLDMNTSGVLVAAKDKATASAAHAQFRNKTVAKAYLCLAVGVPQQQQFEASGPIGDHQTIKVARRVVEGGLPALTRMRVLSSSAAPIHAPAAASSEPGRGEAAGWGPAAPNAAAISHGCCLVCCQPVTGRTHQIRVHMAAAGHSLIGDELYGLQGPWIARQALHATALTLQHPGTGQPVTFLAPPPEDFVAAAASLHLTVPDSSEILKVVQ